MIYIDATRKLIDWLIDNAPEVPAEMIWAPHTSKASPVMCSAGCSASCASNLYRAISNSQMGAG